jgi:hypothetical protein
MTLNSPNISIILLFINKNNNKYFTLRLIHQLQLIKLQIAFYYFQLQLNEYHSV